MGPAAPVVSHYPRLVEDDVYACGFTSPKSYGAASYLILSPRGNWMTDAPRFAPPVVDFLRAHGGLKRIFLTHRDDVADAAEYARLFGAERVIHEADADAAPGAERILRGSAPVELEPGFTIIPTPGHTRGHCVLLHADKFLFTGDHLEGEPDTGELDAIRDYCWYSWDEQVRSIEKLRAYRFEWVLPGHGRRMKRSPDEMLAALDRLVAKARTE
jgi:glyoxylase-like metal-dependent hydrolase (beta-lactamase superfamily II)